MSLQNEVNKVESTIKSDLPAVEADAKKPITVRLWVAIAAILVAAVLGHLL